MRREVLLIFILLLLFILTFLTTGCTTNSLTRIKKGRPRAAPPFDYALPRLKAQQGSAQGPISTPSVERFELE